MELARLEPIAGVALIVTGLSLAVASMIAVGGAQSWDVADAFAADIARPIRQVGMLVGAASLAGLIVTLPIILVRLYGTPGFSLGVVGWIAFAGGTSLFLTVLGLTTIALPALGQLASSDGISPQQIVDQFVRQPGIVVGFLAANASYLSWLLIGVALVRSGVFPTWLGWVLAGTGFGAWLGFLHVPVFQKFGGLLWALSIVVLGIHVLRFDLGTS